MTIMTIECKHDNIEEVQAVDQHFEDEFKAMDCMDEIIKGLNTREGNDIPTLDWDEEDGLLIASFSHINADGFNAHTTVTIK